MWSLWSLIAMVCLGHGYAAPPSLQSLSCADGEQCVQLGIEHFNAKAYNSSKPFFEAACAAKVGSGCRNLAVMLHQGLGEDSDSQRAFGYFEQACLYGEADVCTIVGHNYDERKMYPQAAQFFKAGCSFNESESCLYGGIILLDPAIEPTDPAIGITLLDRGCTLGEGDACEGLGRVYFTGQGVPKDQIQGKNYFKKGCDLKYQSSCDVLAKVSGTPKVSNSFNLSVDSLTADGLEARKLNCKLTKTNMFSSMLIVGGLAKQKSALDDCANGAPQTPQVSMTFQEQRPTNVNVANVSVPVAECIVRALENVTVDASGYCEVTLSIGTK